MLSAGTDSLCSVLTTLGIAWNVSGMVTRVTLVIQHMLQVTQAATILALESKHNFYEVKILCYMHSKGPIDVILVQPSDSLCENVHCWKKHCKDFRMPQAL